MGTPELEKVLNGIHVHRDQMNPAGYRFTTCDDCPYKDPEHECFRLLMNDVVCFVEAQQPRVLTLEEVVVHYSLPPVFPDDLGMQFDYLNDIQPLYFDFPHPEDPWIVHWRKYDEVGKYLDGWKADYGKTWRCWTSRPTDEQRKAVPWGGCDDACPIEGSDAD